MTGEIPTLETILAAKEQHLKERKAKTPIDAVRALASMQERPQPFLSAVSEPDTVLLVGHVRYTVPDRGKTLNTYDPVSLAVRYAGQGADAITLFTDETIYYGGLDDLMLMARAVDVPVISQDYVLDEYQVVEARAAGASALVLNAAVLDEAKLRNLVSATQRNRMTAIVQVFNEEQMQRALHISPHAIAIGTSAPDRYQVEMETVRRLRPLIPPQIRVMVSGGIQSLDDVQAVLHLRVDALSVAESLIAKADIAQKLQALLKRSPNTP